MLALRTTPRLFGWGPGKDAGLGSEAIVGGSPPRRVPDHRAPQMDNPPERARFGPYRLLRTLDACPGADRYLALHEKRQTSHVVYRFGVSHDAAERRRFLAAVQPLACLDQPHLLPVEEYSFAADSRGWVVTPYTGSQIGLMTLARLLADKGGRMSPSEAQRALTHTLEAVQSAHEIGLCHGPLSPDQILIDRRGSATIELYGLDRRLHSDACQPGVDSVRQDEITSLVRLGYVLLTGLNPASLHISSTRLVKRLDRKWDAFFAAGLNPQAGFASAADALAALPGSSAVPAPPTPAPSRVRPIVTLGFRTPAAR